MIRWGVLGYCIFLTFFFNLLFLLLDQAYGAEVIGLAVQSNIDVFEDVADLGDVLCNNM